MPPFLTPRARAGEIALVQADAYGWDQSDSTVIDQSDVSETSSKQPLMADLASTPGQSMPSVGEEDETPLRPAHIKNGGEEFSDVVQFSSPIFYCDSHETSANIDIMRIGSGEGACSVVFMTRDGSAKVGAEYHETTGVVNFKAGEDLKAVKIPIVDSRSWATTSEFTVKLGSSERCVLGSYLHTARVKVIRDDPFPSRTFARKENESDNEDDSEARRNPWLLYADLVKLLWNAPGMRWRTIACLLVEQCYNLYLYTCLYLQQYMVDEIFGEEGGEERRLEEEAEGAEEVGNPRTTLLWIASAFIFPIIALEVLNHFKVSMHVDGRVATFLKKHMVNQFLNYNQESRAEIGDTRLQGVIMEEADEVAMSYMLFIELLKLFGKVGVLCCFVFEEAPGALPSCVAMPILMLIFSRFRGDMLGKAAKEFVENKLVVRRVVQETCHNFFLISSYQQRPRMNDIFLHAREQAEDAHLELSAISAQNKGFASMMGPLFISIHIAFTGPSVLAGGMSLGTFLATIAVFKEFAEVYSEVYACYLEIQRTLNPLVSLTQCFNMPLELVERKNLNRMRRRVLNESRTKLRRTAIGSDVLSEGPRTDRVAIFAQGLCWNYHHKPAILRNVNMTIPQGTITGICGPHRSGKSTLMQLLGNIIIPSQGSVFVPSHLRVLYVPEELILFGLSAWANITFGFPHAHPRRVKEILIGLGMSQALEMVTDDLRKIGREKEMDELPDQDYIPGHNEQANAIAGSTFKAGEIINWHESLSGSEKLKISVGRALITNPEVLILQRPTSALQPDDKEIVMEALVANVRNRGYKLPEKKIKYRRPRTLILSSATHHELEMADTIWEMDLETKGIFESNLDEAIVRQESRLDVAKEKSSMRRVPTNGLDSPAHSRSNTPPSERSLTPPPQGQVTPPRDAVGDLRYPRGHFLSPNRNAMGYSPLIPT